MLNQVVLVGKIISINSAATRIFIITDGGSVAVNIPLNLTPLIKKYYKVNAIIGLKGNVKESSVGTQVTAEKITLVKEEE